MDPQISPAEATEWIKLFQLGGNAGIMVLAIFAIKIGTAFLAALRGVIDTQQKNHAEVIAGQEQIKRAIVAINPGTENVFRTKQG